MLEPNHSQFFEGAMNISELFTPPTHQWHVDGLLRAGTLNLLAADPKAGKSHLARQLAAATVNGGKFLGSDTRQGRVFLFALEEKQEQVREHLTQLGVSDNVIIVPIGYTIPEDGTSRLARMLDADKSINLVIFDPIFKFVHVRDVDDYTQVNEALSPIASLAARTNVTMLATHHANKSYFNSGGGSILGSQAVRANTSANFILQRHLTANGDERSLYAEGRGVNFPDTELINRSDGFTILGDSLTAARARKSKDRKDTKRNSRTDKILSAVVDNPAINTADLVEVVGVSKAIVLKTLESLTKDGHIVRTGTGTKASPYRFSPKEIEVAA
jgi:RecA-family ATPase